MSGANKGNPQKKQNTNSLTTASDSHKKDTDRISEADKQDEDSSSDQVCNSPFFFLTKIILVVGNKF